jgi:hypothetical protein
MPSLRSPPPSLVPTTPRRPRQSRYRLQGTGVGERGVSVRVCVWGFLFSSRVFLSVCRLLLPENDSPRRNIFEMTRSRLMGLPFFPPGGTSVQSSLTFSSTLRLGGTGERVAAKEGDVRWGRGREEGAPETRPRPSRDDTRKAKNGGPYAPRTSRAAKTHMLQWRSNARTLPSSLWLLRKLMRTMDPFLTLRMRIDRGPRASCSCSVSSGGTLTAGAADARLASTLHVRDWGVGRRVVG